METNLFWAFAVDTERPRGARRRNLSMPRRNLSRYQLTSCSPRLKEAGVRAGMSFGEAKRIAPDMRVIVCNR